MILPQTIKQDVVDRVNFEAFKVMNLQFRLWIIHKWEHNRG